MRAWFALSFGLLTALSAGSVRAAPPPSQVEVRVDWPRFVGRHDLTFARLPDRWDRGAFLGNGRMGAMVYQDLGVLAFELGETSITDHQPPRPGAPGPIVPMTTRPRLPIGKLTWQPRGTIIAGTMRLDLWNAELTAKITTSRGSLELRAYLHAQEPLLVVDVEAGGGESPDGFEFWPAHAINEVKLFRRFAIQAPDVNPPPYVVRRDGAKVSVQPRNSGGAHAVGWREQRGGAAARTLLLSIADLPSAEVAPDLMAATLARAARFNPVTLRERHRAYWHSYYPQSFVSLPDTRLEGFYLIQMYKLACATRADAPAIDTLGPWYHRTPWPGIWWNLNVQLSYWPVYTANRLALGESLLALIDRNRENLRKNAGGLAEAAAVGRTSAQDADSPVTDNDANPRKEHELGNLTWALHNYWLHYRHTMDDQMLRERLYPALREAINYYLHRATRDRDGVYHLPVAVSPEYERAAADTNYDLSLLRWGLTALIWSAERLALSEPRLPHYREVLAHLAPYPRGANGLDIGRDVPLSVSHRHFSHLLMIYPLSLLTPETPADRALIEKSLAHWIGFEGALQGYSFVAASAISSRLGRGDDALAFLNQLISRFVKRNTMYMEAGPVIETPLAAAQAVHEMLLQSHNGVVRVFPALPANFSDVSFARLRTEGAFVVSAQKRGGRVQFVAIESLAGEALRVMLPFVAPAQHGGSRTVSLKANGDGSFTIDLKRGETVVIGEGLPGPKTFAVTAVAVDGLGDHAFGVLPDGRIRSGTAASAARPAPAGKPPAIPLRGDGFVRSFALRDHPTSTVYSNNGWEEIVWRHLPQERIPPVGASRKPGTMPWWTAEPGWRAVDTESTCVDLTAASEVPGTSRVDNRIAYLNTTIVSSRRQEAILRFGSSDQLRVELWGEGKIFSATSFVSRPVKADENELPVVLRAGDNPLLLKVINERGAWGACLRVLGTDGQPLTGIASTRGTDAPAAQGPGPRW